MTASSQVCVHLTRGWNASPLPWAGAMDQKELPTVLAVPCASSRVGEKPCLISPLGREMKGIQSWSSWLLLFIKAASRISPAGIFRAFSQKVLELTSGNCGSVLPGTFLFWETPAAGSSFHKSPETQSSLLLIWVPLSSFLPYGRVEYPPLARHVGAPGH